MARANVYAKNWEHIFMNKRLKNFLRYFSHLLASSKATVSVAEDSFILHSV